MQERKNCNNSDKRRDSEENSHHDLRNAIINRAWIRLIVLSSIPLVVLFFAFVFTIGSDP
jgi:hypothetical protein